MADAENPETEEELEFSLADLAELEGDSIAEVRFESLPAGSYKFLGKSASFEDTTNRDDERRIVLTLKAEVVEVKSLLGRGLLKEDYIGKIHTEKQYVVPEKALEGLGLIRSLYYDLGLPNSGPFGGVEGKEPGFVDGFVDHVFDGNIIEQPRKNDRSMKDARLRLPPRKKPKA